MRTRLLVVLACALVLVAAPPAIAGPSAPNTPHPSAAPDAPAAPVAPAGDTEAPVTTLGQQPDGGGIIPQPGSGTEPQDAGDRGGALQTLLFVAMLGGVVVIAALVVRESRRARAERGF